MKLLGVLSQTCINLMVELHHRWSYGKDDKSNFTHKNNGIKSEKFMLVFLLIMEHLMKWTIDDCLCQSTMAGIGPE